MTIRNYANLQSDSRVLVKSGMVGGDHTHNNYYWRNDGFASGILKATDLFVDYREWPRNAENRLYGKLSNAVAGGDRAELLTAAAEWRESLEMVYLRTQQILESYKKLRRFDLPGVVRQLTKPVARPAASYRFRKNERGFTSWNRKKKSNNYQSLTEGWLEYWMGWAPAMGDIYTALDVLQRPFPPQHISVARRYKAEYEERFDYPNYKSFEQVKHEGVISVYGDLEITNYNLYLMNQMGLLNPLNTGYQIIPFSFVLNWFVNVEQCLKSLSDFAGVKLVNKGMGHYQSREGSKTVDRKEWDTAPDGSWYLKDVREDGSYTGYSRQRIPGRVPEVQLIVKFDRLSLSRAATAVSLLVEVFLRKR